MSNLMGGRTAGQRSECLGYPPPHTHMNILLPELLRKTLRQGSKPMLPSRKRTRGDIPSQTGSSTREDQRTPFPLLNVKLLERSDNLPSERKSRYDIKVNSFLDFFGGDFEERFPDSMTRVP